MEAHGSIAMKPLCQPPFPLERIEEMTALMAATDSFENKNRKVENNADNFDY